MASTNFTPHYQLNRWKGEDKPKRDDFNSDNTKIDAALFALQQGTNAHSSNATAHISPTERDRWNAGKALSVYSYEGDGQTSRLLALGFSPSFALLFAVGKGLTEANYDNGLLVYSAVAVPQGATQFCKLVPNGIEIKHSQTSTPSGTAYKLNEPGVTYLCLYLA